MAAAIMSCAHWLSWQCGLSPGAAREHVRVARSLESLPLIEAAFAEGRLSYSKVRALTRIAEPDTEVSLLDLALQLTASQVERTVRQWRRADRGNAGTEPEAPRPSFEYWWDDNGMLVAKVCLAPEDGATFIAALESPAERSARRERAQQDADRRAGDPPRREVIIHVDAAVLADDAAAGRAYIEGGPALSPATARRMLCEATVVTMLEHGREPLAVGRRKRRATKAQRSALFRRDGGVDGLGDLEVQLDGRCGDTFVGVHPIDTVVGRRPRRPRSSRAPSGRSDRTTRPGGRRSIGATLFPDGEPVLPDAPRATGERMDMPYVIGVLMGNRDLVRRLAAEQGVPAGT